jgi:2-C-methyl-D-erythritol 4-phosphate cytidylyltransferase
MIYAGILAAGLGKRMHRQDMPKPFLHLGSKPIIIHTLEQFFINSNVDKIIITVGNDWCNYTEDLIAEYNFTNKETIVINGGINKTTSIKIITDYISQNFNSDNDDILLLHDAIRPFINQRIINENIETAKLYGAANTAVETNDAILKSDDGKILNEVPPHEIYFAEQTPQTYQLKRLMNIFNKLKDTDLSKETELPRLYISDGKEMRLVSGEYYNMKIINPYDLEIANSLLKEREKG